MSRDQCILISIFYPGAPAGNLFTSISFHYDERERVTGPMKIRNRGLRLAVSVALMSAATAVLWFIKSAGVGSHHLYLYLLPVILIRIFCGTRLAMFWAAAAIVLGNFFLQDPLYSLYNDNPLEYGDLVCFVILAVTAIKSTPSRRERAASHFPVADPQEGRGR
jgi:K+-sensing histidine kinase KdpD